MTRYLVEVRYHARPQQVIVSAFDTMVARAIYIIGLGLSADVLREWEL